MRRSLSRRQSHDHSCGPLRNKDSVSKVTEHDGREAEIDFYLGGVSLTILMIWDMDCWY